MANNLLKHLYQTLHCISYEAYYPSQLLVFIIRFLLSKFSTIATALPRLYYVLLKRLSFGAQAEIVM